MRAKLIRWSFAAALLLGVADLGAQNAPDQTPLGLPPLLIPAHNSQTPEKVALGKKLFDDKRFSSTGDVACANCHDAQKAFTDGPLPVSEGINKLTGTRNAPTVINAAYFETQFWDGRSPTLEIRPFTPSSILWKWDLRTMNLSWQSSGRTRNTSKRSSRFLEKAVLKSLWMKSRLRLPHSSAPRCSGTPLLTAIISRAIKTLSRRPKNAAWIFS